MLSSRFTQASRIVASSSTKPLRSLHATAARAAAVETRAETHKRREEEREGVARLEKSHVVLGHRPGDDAKWLNCDLAKILVTPEAIKAVPIPPMTPSKTDTPAPTDENDADCKPPAYVNFGLGERDKSMLFTVLPSLSTERSLEIAQNSKQVQPEFIQAQYPTAQFVEKFKTNMLARVVDLRNANARGIAYENRRRCVAAFSEPDKPNDTGRPEVQAALLTMQVRDMWDHLVRNPKDVSNRRSLRRLIHKRAKMLRYLKGVDEDRYDRVLERLGLERSSVEGELNV